MLFHAPAKMGEEADEAFLLGHAVFNDLVTDQEGFTLGFTTSDMPLLYGSFGACQKDG